MYRLDFLDVPAPTKTVEGFLRFYARVSRVGELVYCDASGNSYVEKISADELFDSDSIISARMKPVTLLHPSSLVVDVTNAREDVVGWVGNVYPDTGYLVAEVVVTDKVAIAMIESGQTLQVSAGYWCDIDANGYQRRRRYNHFALVPRGRAGDDVGIIGNVVLSAVANGLNLDSSDVVFRKLVSTITIGQQSFDVGDDKLVLAIASLNRQVADLKTQLSTARNDGANLANSEHRARVAQLEEQIAQLRQDSLSAEQRFSQKLSEQLTERLDIWLQVSPHLDGVAVEPKLSATDVKKLLIMKHRPSLNIDGKDDAFIDGIYQLLISDLGTVPKGERQVDSLRRILEQSRSDSGDGAAVNGVGKRGDNYVPGWKKPFGVGVK